MYGQAKDLLQAYRGHPGRALGRPGKHWWNDVLDQVWANNVETRQWCPGELEKVGREKLRENKSFL